jgi:hypothetical protein
MKKSVLASLALLLGVAALSIAADSVEMPEMPAPQKEHQWLQKFVGDWITKSEISMPGQDPMTVEGTETVKSLGGFWIVSDLKCDFGGQQMHGIMTVGYDPKTKQYVGSWIDSMTDHFWKYEGELDASGKKLTLNSEGPCPMKGGQLTKMRDVVEFQDDDTRTLTSYAQGDDGQWQSFMKMTATRKK